MKWVKFNDDFIEDGYLSDYSLLKNEYIKNTCFYDLNMKEDEFERERLYKEEGSKKIGVNQFHKWIYQKVPGEYVQPKYFNPKYFRRKNEKGPVLDYKKVQPHPYEIFIGGWLHFYDSEVQNGNSDHAVYFDWDILDHSVTVYIFQLKPQDKRFNINVNVNINPPGSQDPPPPKIPPPYC